MDPWRYYEMVRIVDEPYEGRCLDVSSPKLLPSLLNGHGMRGPLSRASTVGRDQSWHVDVQDATRLEYPDESFDNVLCISVLEHIGGGGDALAFSEFWRVLRPGGVLYLTTDVAEIGRDVYLGKALYGGASPTPGDQGVFFRETMTSPMWMHWSKNGLGRSTSANLPCNAVLRSKSGSTRLSPFSFVVGPLLGFFCSSNFETSTASGLVSGTDHGVIYLKLIKPSGA